MAIKLYKHQILILVFILIVLISGINWGLPNQNRLDLLISNSDITDRQLELISKDRKEYYERLNKLKDQRLKNFKEGKQIDFFSKPKIGNNQPILSQKKKRTWFRDYILGSSAVDERKAYSALSQMNINNFDFELKTLYGGAYVYPIGILIYFLKSLGYIEITKDLSKYVESPQYISRMYVCGRILNVLALFGTLLLLVILGNYFYGFACGTTAMLIYAFSPYPLNHSVVSKPHVYASFWIMFGLFLLIRYHINRKNFTLILSAVCCGLGSGSIYPSVICLIMYPVLLFDNENKQQSLKLITKPIIISIIVIFMTNPYFLINPLSNWLKFLYVGSANGLDYLFSINRLYKYLSLCFCVSICFPFGVLGLFFSFKEISGKDSLIKRLCVLFLSWLLILILFLPNVRVSIFILPLLCVITSFGMYQFLSQMKYSRQISIVLFIPGLIFFTIFSYCTIYHDRHYESMKEWTETIKPDDRIGFFETISPVNMPAFPFLNRTMINMKFFNKIDKNLLPLYIVIGNYSRKKPQKWHQLSIDKYYQLIKICGMPFSNSFLKNFINMNQSRKAIYIYKKRN